MLSASYYSASSGFRLLGKIPAGAITEQKREVRQPVERPYVNTVTKVTVRILIFCVPRNMGNVCMLWSGLRRNRSVTICRPMQLYMERKFYAIGFRE